jgi:uncharacterized membrane protein
MGRDREEGVAEGAIVRWSAIIMGSGVCLILLQLILEFVWRFQNPTKSLTFLPIGLLVLVVGAILLAFASYNGRSTLSTRAGNTRAGNKRAPRA